jgi:hypothetical protein
MKKYLFVFGLMIFLFSESGCKKEEVISNVPSIKFVSIAPNPAVRYNDVVKLIIEYTDGNGDLGENTPDVKNAFITDTRNNVVTTFRINQLAPNDANIIIKGNLEFNLSPQGFVDDNNTTETATYKIYVVDRAGNKSNEVNSTALVINK